MYNEERKSRYIEYKESNTITPLRSLERVFEALEPYEEKYGKDCCNFTEDEILEFYKMLGTRSIGVITNHNSRLSLYTDWCLSQGFVTDGQNHYRALKRTDFNNCINSLAIHVVSFNREEWLEEISKLPNPRDQFITLYLFEVGTKNMMDYLQDITIDWFEGNVLHLSDRDVIVSDLLVSYAKKADEEEYVYSLGTSEKKFRTEPTGKIVKWKRSRDSGITSRHRFGMIFAKIFNYMGYPTLKAKEVERMGQLDMINKIAKENAVTIEEVISNSIYFDKVKQQYGITSYTNSYMAQISGYLQ